MLPSVKAEKEHGAWFKGWRSVKAAGSKGAQWFRDIGLSDVSIDIVQTGINAPKPTHSTPNYAEDYGVDASRTSSAPASSHSSPITAPTSAPQPTFIPPTVEEPTFGPQNPFFPTTTLTSQPQKQGQSFLNL